MFNTIEFEVKSSRREKDYYNIIEDELEILIDSAYSFKVDDKYMNVLKAFNNLIKTINRNNSIDSALAVKYTKALRESYYEAESIGKNIILDYTDKWIVVIFKNIMKYHPETTNKILVDYVVEKDNNGLIDFYLYVIHGFYKKYFLDWIDIYD